MHSSLTSRALRVDSEGSLALEAIEVPPPGPGEARVRVLASSATLSDSVVRRGFSPYLQTLVAPFTLGYDLVGYIESVGDGDSGLRVGDLVADLTRYGANADVVVRPKSSLTRLPSDLEPVVVEPLVMSGMTALQMLTRVAHLSLGESVLVVGASGSVGLFVVALAMQLGAAVVMGTASVSKLDLVAGQGGVPIDRDRADLSSSVRRRVPRGVDVIVDSAGTDVAGLGRLLAPGGRLVTFGVSGLARGGGRKTPEALEIAKYAFGRGRAAITEINATGKRWAATYDVGEWREQHRDWFDADLGWLLTQVRSGALRPVFQARSLQEAMDVHGDIDEGRVHGRFVFDHLVGPFAPRHVEDRR